MASYYTSQNQTYLPTRVKVNSLGIAIADDTREALNMSTDQYLVCGQQDVVDSSDKTHTTFSLLSDVYGVAININALNSNIIFRDSYALYVSGNIFCDGTITTAQGILSPGSNAYGSNSGGDIFWTSTSDYSGIYYAGNVILGTKTYASVANSNTLSIIHSASRNINQAQVGIQNLATAQFRMGILGAASNSPIVFASSSNVPFEFHSGRNQSYFQPTYIHKYIDNNGVHQSVPVDYPVYDNQASNAPHLKIDESGNVGIHTSSIPSITYDYRYAITTYNPNSGAKETETYYDNKTNTPVLWTDGTLYAPDIVVRDVDTGDYASLDSLYVRRLGIAFLANQVVPGEFALGYYEFQSNISIMGNIEDAYQLKVYGSARMTCNLQVDGLMNATNVQANGFLATGVAGFCNDIIANQNVTIKDSLLMRGGIYTQVNDINGSNLGWCQVQFMVASPTLSNINYIGQGITTPGRFGAGIDPTNTLDAVNNQMVIVKKASDIFGLELRDRTIVGLVRSMLIGQPDNTERPLDASTVFATPQALDINYNMNYRFDTGISQNIYFYPGADLSPTGGLILSSNNPPVLGLYARTGRVGIGTYTANATLHVEGGVYSASNYSVFDTVSQSVVTLAVWHNQEQINTNPAINSLYINGITYYNPSAPHVGVNTEPNGLYGLTVSGGFKSIDGLYSPDDRLTSLWYNTVPPAYTSNATVTPEAKYANGFVGIGHTSPERTLDIISGTDASILRVRGSSFSDASAVEFQTAHNMWTMAVSQYNGTFAVFDSLQPSYSTTAASNVSAVWCGTNPISGKYQVSIGCSDVDRLNTPYSTAALLVNGGVSVVGDVNVTGTYSINGVSTAVANSNISYPVPDTNDIFIGGGDIYFNPTTTGTGDPYTQRTVAIGYNSNLRPLQKYNTSILRVLGPNTVIASFYTHQTTGLIQIFYINPTYSSQQPTRGVQMGFQDNNDFALLDINGNPYMTFLNSTDKYMGFNLPASATAKAAQPTQPTAICHIYSGVNGQNMLRLTNFANADVATIGAEMSLEKVIPYNNNTQANTYSWFVHGPEFGYNQKLTFLYSDTSTSTVRNEVMCITPSGCLGIGNSMPVYGLDVKGVGSQGSLRLYSTYNSNLSITPSPQLIIQSGSSTFGADSLTDYRVYAYNSNFMIQAEASFANPSTILYADAKNNVGIGTSSIGNFTLTVGGDINIEGGLYLNSVELFSASGDLASLSGPRISINPWFGGSVQINNLLGVMTSNLFTIYSGVSPNIAVFDSAFNEAQVSWRNVVTTSPSVIQPVYRLSSSNTAFQLEYAPNINTPTISSTHAGYGVAWEVEPLIGGGTADFAFQVNGILTIAGTATTPVPCISIASYSNILGFINASTLSDNNGSLFIKSSNVGIGTGVPTATLEVNSINTNNANTTHDILRVASSSNSFLTVDYQGTTTVTSNMTVGNNFTVVGQSALIGNVEVTSNLVVDTNCTVKGYFTNTSDRRVKTDLQPIESALDKVCKLSGYTYTDIAGGNRKVGLIAQEVQAIFPEAVRADDDGMLSIAYGNLVAVLIEAIKELRTSMP